MRTLAPGTVAVAIFAVTGCSSFGLRDGGRVAHKAPTATRGLATPYADTAATPGDAFLKLGGVPSDWQQNYVADQLQLGAYHEQQHRWRDAAACYERALQKDPRNFAAHHRLAIVNDLQGHFVEAEQHYLAALESDITNSDVLSDLGYSYLLQRRFRESEQALSEAVQNQPNHQFALGHLGTLHGLRGDYQRAREYFTRAGGELRAQQELAKLFPFGPQSTGTPVDVTGQVNPFDDRTPAESINTNVSTRNSSPNPPPNEATRKLAEQIAMGRQKLTAANATSPGNPGPPGQSRAGYVASGASAADIAAQRRQSALEYLRSGPTPPSAINRAFSQLDAEAARALPRNSFGNGNLGAGAGRSGDALRHDATTSIAQASAAIPTGLNEVAPRDVIAIPTQPPHGGVAQIPTRIPDTTVNPFAAPGDSRSVEQARAIAAQMGLNSGSGLLPPVSAPDVGSRSQPAATSPASGFVGAPSTHSESILMQPPIGSPTVRQSLSNTAAQQAPSWNGQAAKNSLSNDELAPWGHGPAPAKPSAGDPTTNPQLIPRGNCEASLRLLPNAEGVSRANLLPNANVAAENVRPAADVTRSSTDLMSQFQLQQQQILQLQQELDRVRQQGGTYQLYQHSTGMPSSQALPR
jgi:tetratricopeptide (TPR) repeat protein